MKWKCVFPKRFIVRNALTAVIKAAIHSIFWETKWVLVCIDSKIFFHVNQPLELIQASHYIMCCFSDIYYTLKCMYKAQVSVLTWMLIWFSNGCIYYHCWLFSFTMWVNSVQSVNHVRLLVTPWTAACQASLSITNSWSLLIFMSIESVMPSHHLILCRPILLLPSIFPSIRVFPNESVLHIRWPKYCTYSFSISSSSEYQDWFPLGWTGWISLLSKGLSRVFSNTTVQKHQFFTAQLSL